MRLLLEVVLVLVLIYQHLNRRGVSGVQSCRAKLDLVIIVDSSTSVGSRNFKKIIDFVGDLTDQLPVQQDGIRVALVRYSTNAEVITFLDEAMNKDEKIKAVRSMPYRTGSTYTNRALALTRKSVLVPERGGRPDVPTLIILITDGVSTNQRETRTESFTLKENPNLKILSLGIGSYITDEELKVIASRPDMVHRVTDFSDLPNIVGHLAALSCSGFVETQETTPEIETREPTQTQETSLTDILTSELDTSTDKSAALTSSVSFTELSHANNSTTQTSQLYSTSKQLTTTKSDVTSDVHTSTKLAPSTGASSNYSKTNPTQHTSSHPYSATTSPHTKLSSPPDSSSNQNTTININSSVSGLAKPGNQRRQSTEDSSGSSVQITTTLTTTQIPPLSTTPYDKDTTSLANRTSSVNTQTSRMNIQTQNVDTTPASARTSKSSVRKRTTPGFSHKTQSRSHTTQSYSHISITTSNMTVQLELLNTSFENPKYLNTTYYTYNHGGDLSSRDVYIFTAGGTAAGVILTAASIFVTALFRRRKNNRTLDRQL